MEVDLSLGLGYPYNILEGKAIAEACINHQLGEVDLSLEFSLGLTQFLRLFIATHIKP